ncbi:MAG: hypothetical protein ACR2QM_07075 [Longimicrobiales bacterium]
MYHRCLVCSRAFEENAALEHLPRGERIAYDPSKGRLWAICSGCKRWSLIPIEERWEALEELERLTSDSGRLLSQTDNVALIRAGSLEVVRVGQAGLREEAWWRYGRELQDRRARFKKLSAVGSLGAGAAIMGSWATGGVSFIAAWFLWDRSPDAVTNSARWFRFGSRLWRGSEECPTCGHTFTGLRFSERMGLIVTSGEDEGTVVTARCPRCRGARGGGLHLSGQAGDRVLRRVLAYHHFSGASERRVTEATRLIEVVGGPEGLPQRVLRDGKRIGDLGRIGGIALEIAANQRQEQELLEMELAELEAHWRREEELAEIIDGELTPLPFVKGFRRRISGLK